MSFWLYSHIAALVMQILVLALGAAGNSSGLQTDPDFGDAEEDPTAFVNGAVAPNQVEIGGIVVGVVGMLVEAAIMFVVSRTSKKTDTTEEGRIRSRRNRLMGAAGSSVLLAIGNLVVGGFGAASSAPLAIAMGAVAIVSAVVIAVTIWADYKRMGEDKGRNMELSAMMAEQSAA